MNIRNSRIIYVSVALVLTALNFLFLGSLWQHLMIICFDFWYKVFNIYPMFQQTQLELFLMNLFPIIVAVFLMRWKIKGVWRGLIFFIFAYATVLAATLLGNVMSLVLWGRNGINPLLPIELRAAPFPFYWLTFLLMGILFYWIFAKKVIWRR
jgi:hypothetical protein